MGGVEFAKLSRAAAALHAGALNWTHFEFEPMLLVGALWQLGEGLSPR